MGRRLILSMRFCGNNAISVLMFLRLDGEISPIRQAIVSERETRFYK